MIGSWTKSVWDCVVSNGNADFELSDMYAFEEDLSTEYPANNHIRDKIRQQLQVLRNLGFVSSEFSGEFSVTPEALFLLN